MNIFEINELNFVEKSIGPISVLEMDNFYKHPEKVVEFLNNNPANFHKSKEKGFNGIHFDDKRHEIEHKDFNVPQTLANYFGFNVSDNTLVTNQFVMKDNEFNKPMTHYWAPHCDPRPLACLIYLNTFDCDGTNFYSENVNAPKFEQSEHENPWRHKKHFRLLGTTQAKFNRACIFRGNSVLHGMALNKTFVEPCKEKRLNQVIFI